MRSLFKLLLSTTIALVASDAVRAQDLNPRAYTITPLHSNAFTFGYAYFSGALDFNGAVPIKSASGQFSVPSVGYYHSFRLFGRSASVLAVLPYGVGNFQGIAFGTEKTGYRSGLLDSVFRISVNLKGGPAMELPEFVKWRQKTLLGVSFKVIAPTGQYNPDLLINWSTNRWSLKPEFGYSRSFRNKWVVDAYAGAWFFTSNPAFFVGLPSPVPQSLTPIGSIEGHISRDLKPRLWVSLDGNFWFGGTATNGSVTLSGTRQTASRLGVTASFPLNNHQTLKVSYSTGAYVRFGGDYQNVSVAWQYSWNRYPK